MFLIGQARHCAVRLSRESRKAELERFCHDRGQHNERTPSDERFPLKHSIKWCVDKQKLAIHLKCLILFTNSGVLGLEIPASKPPRCSGFRGALADAQH
jgi:hypothetical protein